MTDLQNRIVGVIGRKGAGKSTRVATLLKYAPRLIVWDPMDEHWKTIPNNLTDDVGDLSRRTPSRRRSARGTTDLGRRGPDGITQFQADYVAEES